MRFIYTKTFAIFFACLVILVILVFFQTKGWLNQIRTLALKAPRPVIVAVKSVGLPVKNFFVNIYHLRQIASQNSELQNQVIQLQQALVETNQQAYENEALRKELGFAKTSKFQLEPCTVLSNNPFGADKGLIINCGLDRQITTGQAVVSGGILVGKITFVGESSSNVLLISSSNFSTDAKANVNSATGVVKGSFGSGLIFDQVDQSADLPKGSLVVTAGINEQIPKNILIGQVSEILSSNNDLFKKAALSSPVDLSNIDFVFVVK